LAKHLIDNESSQIIKVADLDGDGKIGIEDFKKLYTKLSIQRFIRIQENQYFFHLECHHSYQPILLL